MTDRPRSASTTARSEQRILHFVTGGFSGATQVAVDLALAGAQQQGMQTLLVLRRKRTTDAARVQALRARGLQVEVLPGWSHLATLWALWRLCRAWRPDVLVAHGFPEHLLGRQAGVWAGVARLVQVAHNSRERYGVWSLWRAHRLEARTARVIAVSEGVRESLIARGFSAGLIQAVPNGIDLERFPAEQVLPLESRVPGIVMSARFSRQKDHLSLIRALAELKGRGLRPPLFFAGAGKDSYRREAEAEVARLGLQGQVQFLGHHAAMPQLLMSHAICVLATHYEGMPLALVEGMAAGCACVASAVPGVQGVIDSGRNGLLVPEGDVSALADALQRLLVEPEFAQALGSAARLRAVQEHGLPLMRARYEEIFRSL